VDERGISENRKGERERKRKRKTISRELSRGYIYRARNQKSRFTIDE